MRRFAVRALALRSGADRTGVDDAAVGAWRAKHSAALTCGDLTVNRGGRTVLDSVSFRLRSGEIMGLFGPSGSGKTTLMRAIVGLQSIGSGRLTVLGVPAGTASLRARLAYTTQAPAVYTDLSVRENLRYFARIAGARQQRVEETIDDVGLRECSDRVVAALSGGQMARVSLAVALLGDAEVLILDEPTVGLDPLLRLDLWTLFRALAADGRTLLVSSHVLDEARRCDRVLLLREGRLLATGTPDAICARAGATNIEDAFIALEREGAQEGSP